jgi:hypothetical protein
MALILASMIGGISIASAYQEYNHRRGGYYDGRRGYYDNRRVYHKRYYRSRVYETPPVVVYDPYPYQSPGISLFLPIPFR